MRKVLRSTGVDEYWRRRWARAEADRPVFEDTTIYPVAFVEPHARPGVRILEAGCGLGRLVSHLHRKGCVVVGFDYVEAAAANVRRRYPELRLLAASVLAMPFPDRSFDVVTAFGVLHSIELLEGVRRAVGEALRCLRPGGVLVVSARADNIENRLIDRITDRREGTGDRFHKWCFTEGEFRGFVEEAGGRVERVDLVTNVPFLHKFSAFRASGGSEAQRRSAGYRLNAAGRALYAALRAVSPRSFGTTLVLTARR